jgi:dTDP-4-amino-4,6-dideoxygalactose transaminase
VRLRAGSQRDVLQALLDRGIGAKRGCANAHQEPAYAKGARHLVAPGGLGVSERLRDSTIVLPLFHGMSRDEQDLVIQAAGDVAAEN